MKPVISTIKDIYPSSQAEAQKQRYKSAVTAFAEHFGSIGEHRFFSAPGRTEICGNHTDHNHGKVFAASVNLDVIAVVEPTEDDKIVIKSEGFPEDSNSVDALTTSNVYLEMPYTQYASDIETILNAEHDAIMTMSETVDEGIQNMNDQVPAVLG